MSATKKELLAQAANLKIVGRSDMTKEALEAAIAKIVDQHKEVAKARKRAKVANVKRNKPWQFKFYYVDAEMFEAAKGMKMPKQVRQILEGMVELGITSPEHANYGGAILRQVLTLGTLQTKIKPEALFAYYEPLMNQHLGLVFDGYRSL